ncbi:DUF5980 family protein [Saccharothrix lopnurensis]|uniref:DUF5980 family protein n=1 Tax=Saccharothrix lopnurensis TaxID=1670621 RepID=A0ABW1P2T6_9PSEU
MCLQHGPEGRIHQSCSIIAVTGNWSTDLDFGKRDLPPGRTAAENHIPPGSDHPNADDGAVRINGFTLVQRAATVRLATYRAQVRVSDGTACSGVVRPDVDGGDVGGDPVAGGDLVVAAAATAWVLTRWVPHSTARRYLAEAGGRPPREPSAPWWAAWSRGWANRVSTGRARGRARGGWPTSPTCRRGSGTADVASVIDVVSPTARRSSTPPMPCGAECGWLAASCGA